MFYVSNGLFLQWCALAEWPTYNSKSFTKEELFDDVIAIFIAVCKIVVSLCWWWLALQLLIKCSIHFSDRAIKVLLCEHPSPALFRACWLCCRRAVHFCGRGQAEWGLGSSQLTQSLLSGSGSKWTGARLNMDAVHPGIKLGFYLFICFQALKFAPAHPWSPFLHSCTRLWPSSRWPVGCWAPP